MTCPTYMKLVKSIQDALITAEEGEALIKVARNACTAERELAALHLNLSDNAKILIKEYADNL